MIDKHDDYWRQRLTQEQYQILRGKGTEAPFSGALVDNHVDGTYSCAACGQLLFGSDTKFDSGTGWPSFTEPANREHVQLHQDTNYGMERTEVTCANCGSHLGHVFTDVPPDKGGMRYCINSCALDFKPSPDGTNA
jgi:peptide-methionine (R)-S-oxide reductase